MLNVNLIERLFHQGRHERLLEGVLANGQPASLPLKVRLADQPAACVSLGLRRLFELTYSPTSGSLDMLDWLLDQQRDDGSFGRDPLTTACAAAAFVEAAHVGLDEARVADALDRALEALAGMQAGDGLFISDADRSVEDRARVTAFISHLLTQHERFRMTVRFADLMNWFDDHAGQLDDAARDLWLMTLADQRNTRCASGLAGGRITVLAA